MSITEIPYADLLEQHRVRSVRFALEEDIGSGDITAELIPAEQMGRAEIITRETGILAGQAWVDEVFRQVDATTLLQWHQKDGDQLHPDTPLVDIRGSARSILTAERTALNFLGTLSGTATQARQYANRIANPDIMILDTRKTLPGLRLAQKYAVRVGGCKNHRLGLYDMFLIKENHIAACGGLTQAVAQAKKIAPEKAIEVEVENLAQLQEALQLAVDVIMLDNFDAAMTDTAVSLNKGQIKLERSGNIDLTNLGQKSVAGIDYLSSGKLTKDVTALDLSLRLVVTDWLE